MSRGKECLGYPQIPGRNCQHSCLSTSIVGLSVLWTDLRDCVLNHLLVRHIALISDQQLVHALRSIPVNLLQPLLHVVEAVHIRDIVDDADSVCAAVVGRSDGAESFLSRSIPLSERLAFAKQCLVEVHTICNFTVLPSSSIVLIFCSPTSTSCPSPLRKHA